MKKSIFTHTKDSKQSLFLKPVFLRIAIVLFFIFPGLQMSGQYLVKKGATDFKIVLSDFPQLVEQTAAKELKTCLDEITTIDWIIASEKDIPENAPQILIGNSMLAKKFFPEIDQDIIPYDGIEIHLKGNKLLLTGHKQRGTLYAVYTFLENVLGVRWWTSTEKKIPTYKTFKLKPLNISYAPGLIYREAYYKDALDTIFATRIKYNGHFQNIAPEYGGHHRFTYFVHSFYALIPPKKYFADHPEWFSEIDGERRYERHQLCLSNEEMRKELTKNAIEALRRNPGSRFISISQNDWEGYCTCKSCTQIAEEEGSQSGPLIRFVNAVAEEIEKEFPEVFVETLAYQYTRKPPTLIKPRQNVIIRLCTIECSFVQPLTGEHNTSLKKDMEGWSKIAKQLFVWDYVTNFHSYILPHPNLRVLAPNIRFFVDHGTIGLFEQGDSYCTVGDFVRMRNWVISRLLWNPALDKEKLTSEFLTGYYGKKATPYLLKYFNILIDKAESTGKHIGCFSENTDEWLDYETLCKATAMYDKALAAAEKEGGKNSDFVRRLQRERLSLEHVWLKGYFKFKRYAEAKGEKFMGPADPEESCRNFFAICEKYNVTAYREYDSPKTFADFRDGMIRRFGKQTPVPEEFKNFDSNALVDVQEYDFRTVNIIGWVSMVDDAAASNGRAVRMPGNLSERAATIHIKAFDWLLENTDAETKYKVVVYVRCDATVNNGLAMTCGINDSKERKIVSQKNIDVSEIAGSDYKKIEFDPIPLNQSMYIWFAPPKREGEVLAVYVDRVLIIKTN